MDPYIAFEGTARIGGGSLLDAALACHARVSAEASALTHIFDIASGRLIDVDLKGDAEQVALWLDAHHPDRLDRPRARGRPKLGVVSREVTLLPRHWDWLAAQPGGASATLRKLVDAARRDPVAERRAVQDAVYRFTNATAGDLPGFEEATRALYAANEHDFLASTVEWPHDVRSTAIAMAARVWSVNSAT